MKNLKAKFAILSVIVLMFPATHFAALQKTQKSNLKLSGKILGRQKANITIYLEKNGTWTKVLTIESKTRYTLDLTPDNNYYILFENKKGLKKVIYFDAGEPGIWKTIMDIDFKNTEDSFAKFYHHPIYKEYVFEVINKRIEDSVIYSEAYSPEIRK
tara:strand:+ start:497 stop:967 length:471 start_codon:yes stop_codon:yes gene_type:complete